MKFVTLVLPFLVNSEYLRKLGELHRATEPLPDGVARVASNGWLLDPAKALDWLLKFPQIAESHTGQAIQGYADVPMPPPAD